jgi:hypothetical protein
MRISCRMMAIVAGITLWSGPWVSCARAQDQAAASELVQKLQSDKTTDGARRQLLQLGKTDPDVRRYLIAHLPPMIEMSPKSCPPSDVADVVNRWHTCPWYNAVELAGQLRIQEAVLSLVPWIGWRTPAPLLPSGGAEFLFHPAARALAEIGDPAVPAVQSAVDHGNPLEHYYALRILGIIHTPKAKAALREDLPREGDPNVRAMVKKSIER